jgi:hypothetical protein
MRRIRFLAGIIFGLLAISRAEAQPVTSFPQASMPLSGSEILYLVQGGISKQITTSSLIAASVAGVSSFNSRAGAISLLSADVTNALGFTPYNATNPSAYQTAAQVSTAVGAETSRAEAAESLLAPIASPAFTGSPTGSAGAMTATATGATVPQTLARTLADINNVKASATIAAAEALGPTYVPPGTYASGLASSALIGPFWGFGQISDTSGNRRAKTFAAITAPPASLGNYNSVDTAFNGDWSHQPDSTEYRISGAATLGQPATGYVYTPEATAHYTYLFNTSGWNQSTSGNNGRTAAVAYQVQGFNAGQGDSMSYSGLMFVTGAKAGATNFLANPAGSVLTGQVAAGNAGVYLNPSELDMADNGFDVAANGAVYNFFRTNNTGALGTFWSGVRNQSLGTKAIDASFSSFGLFNIVLDATTATLGTAQAAEVLSAGQRVYLNGTNTDVNGNPALTNPGNVWVEYDSVTSKVVVGNSTTRLFAIDMAGNVVAKGTITPSGTP